MGYHLYKFIHMDSQDPENLIKLTSGIFSINAIRIIIDQKAVTANLQLVMQGLNGKAVTREVY